MLRSYLRASVLAFLVTGSTMLPLSVAHADGPMCTVIQIVVCR